MITLIGSGFVRSPLFRCKVGSLIVPGRWESISSTRAQCVVPRQAVTETLVVEISNNNQDFTTSSLELTMHSPAVVDGLAPAYSWKDASSVVIINLIGKSFHREMELVCTLHSDDGTAFSTTQVEFLNSSICVCQLPLPITKNMSSPILVPMIVAEVAQEDVLFQTTIPIFSLPFIKTVSPVAILERGGSKLQISGMNFLTPEDIECNVDGVHVPFIATNGSIGHCVAPSHAPGMARLELCVSDDRVGCIPSDVTIEYHQMPQLDQSYPWPSESFEDLESNYVITGSGFLNSSSVRCNAAGIGTFIGKFVSSTKIICVGLTHTMSVCEDITVEMDSVTIGTVPAGQCKQATPTIGLIRPTGGPTHGGTHVVVKGGPFDFNNGFKCIFDDVIVSASFFSMNQLFCVSPPSVQGIVDLKISSTASGRITATSNSVHFKYHTAPIVRSLSPTAGSEIGSYNVYVEGDHFIRTPGLRCRFGASDVMAAKWISNTLLSCTAPRHIPGWVDVYVTNNLQDYSSTYERFEFLVLPKIFSFLPQSLTSQEQNSTLVLIGQDFQNSSAMRCVIGGVQTRAEFMSSSKITCLGINPTDTELSVGLMDDAAATTPVYATERLRVLQSFTKWTSFPKIGSVRGGTTIKLQQAAQLDRAIISSEFLCRFCVLSLGECSTATPPVNGEIGEFLWVAPVWNYSSLRGFIELFGSPSIELNASQGALGIPLATLPFQYYHDVVINRLYPDVGVPDGGTVVTVFGTHFRFYEGLSCVINGETFVPAKFISHGAISCVMPAMSPHGGRNTSVGLSLNGQDISDDALIFNYFDLPSIYGVFPSGGSISKLTVARIAGSGFVASPASACVIGDYKVPAVIDSSSQAVCFIHPQESWTSAGQQLVIKFTPNGQEVTSDWVSFFVYRTPELVTMTPYSGSARGSTPLIFTWKDLNSTLYPGANISCQIGDAVVRANTIGTNSIMCRTPPTLLAVSAQGSPVATRVSFNGQSYIDMPSFWYFNDPVINHIYPISAREAIATPIRVYGSGFPRLVSMTCHFGESLNSKAIWMSSTLIVCSTPIHQAGNVTFGFSLNGFDIVDKKAVFEFTSSMDDTGDYYPHFGPTSGGTQVFISVKNGAVHERCEKLACSFGDIVVPAMFSIITSTRSTTIECQSPPLRYPDEVNLSLRCDGRTISALNRPFIYFETPVILDVEPIGIPLGFTSPIIIRGSNFQQSRELLCRFGAVNVVQGFFISDREMRCSFPQELMKTPYSSVGLEISVNGIDFTASRAKIQLLPQFRVLQLSPSFAVAGIPFVVRVTVTDVGRSTSVSCRVGESILIDATVVRFDLIECHLPAIHTIGTLALEVSNSAVDYVTSRTDSMLVILPVPIVASSSRDHGTILGGDQVIFKGLHFSAQLRFRCGFGGMYVPAIYLSSTSVSCISPPWGKAFRAERELQLNSTLSLVLGVQLDPQSPVVQIASDSGRTFSWTYYLQTTVTYSHITPSSLLANTIQNVSIDLPSSFSAGKLLLVLDSGHDKLSFPLFRSSSIDQTQLTTTLRVPDPGSYRLSILENNYTLHEFSLPVKVHSEVTLTIGKGQSSPLRGGTLVIVRVEPSGSDHRFGCNFGGTIVSAFSVGNSAFACRAPPGSRPGPVRLSIIYLDDTYEIVSSRFDYYPDDVVTGVSPGAISQPMRSALLNITGRNFFQDENSNPLCRFGNTSVTEAMIQSSTTALCRIPGELDPGIYSVSLACDGVNFGVSSASIAHIGPPRLISLHPTSVPLSGGSTIQIKGVGFFPEASVKCIYNNGQYRYVVDGSAVASEVIICKTPEISSAAFVTLSLEVNTVVTNSLMLQLIAPVIPTAIYPSVGFTKGGTVVRVQATYIPRNGDIYCVFGATSVPAVWVMDNQAGCKTPEHTVGPVRVQLAGELAGNVDGTGVEFEFIPDVSIIRVEPTQGPVFGGTKVIIILSRTIEITDQFLAECTFGSNTVEAVAISATQLLCRSPPGRLGEQVQLTVFWCDNELVGGPINFAYQPGLSIIAMNPVVGATGREVMLSMSTDGELQTRTYACIFEFDDDYQLMSLARLNSWEENRLMCATPASIDHPCRALVSLWANGERVSANQLTFEFVKPPEVFSVSPVMIPESGGSRMRVLGTRFSRRLQMECHLGDTSVPAVFVTPEIVECISPLTAPGNYSLAVLWNAQDLANNAFHINVYASVSIYKVTPLRVPIGSRANITVVGSGFLSTSLAACRFGSMITAAVAVNRTTLQCAVPVGIPSSGINTVSVEITFDGSTFYRPEEAQLLFYNPPLPKRLHPAAGSVRGGTEIFVFGYYDPVLQFECVFDSANTAVKAAVVNSSLVNCISPRVEAAITDTLFVRVEGEVNSPAVTKLQFRYFEQPLLFTLYPEIVRVSGGGTVELFGQNLASTGAALCRFGDSTPVRGAVVSDKVVICPVPPRVMRGGYGTVEVSLNTVDFTFDKLVVYYHDNSDILQVSPTIVRSIGGTEILVTLTEELYPHGLYQCQFNRASQTLAVPATILGLTQLRCLSPQWTPGVASIGVWLSSSDQIIAENAVELIADPFIESIQPSHGPEAGGTTLAIAGENFEHAKVTCLFNNVSVVPHVVTRTQLECIVPSRDMSMDSSRGKEMATTVQVIIGGTVHSDSVMYMYDKTVTIKSVSTRQISEEGGWILDMNGEHFIDSLELACTVGNAMAASAVFVNSTRIQCHVPASHPTNVQLGITLNGKDYVYFDAELQYEVSPYLESVTPISGSMDGGTTVKLTLRQYTSWSLVRAWLFCQFGGVFVRGIMLTEGEITCVSPSADQPMTVEVSAFWRLPETLEQFSITGSLAFEYEDNPKLTDLMPTMITEGTLLTLYGTNFKRNAFVRFGLGDQARDVRPSVVASTQLGVIIPFDLDGTVIPVSVTHNRVDFSNALTFLKLSKPSIISVFPQVIIRSQLNSSSGSVDLLITGSGFNTSMRDTLLCQIGERYDAVQADWISETQVLCRDVLPHPPGQYSVKLSVNGGADFIDNAIYVIYRDFLTILDLSPSFGSIEGNSVVKVLLSSKRIEGPNIIDGLACLFGQTASPLQIMEGVDAGNSADFRYPAFCRSPPRGKPGPVNFSIGEIESKRVVANSIKNLSFTYVTPPQIDRVDPIVVSTRTPLLRVTGSNFLNSPYLSCSVNSIVLAARYVSNYVVECLIAGNMHLQKLEGESINVTVANNGQDFVNSETALLVVDPIQILRVAPDAGPIRQQVRVKIIGKGFPTAFRDMISCMVGEQTVSRAIFVTSNWVECELPAIASPTQVKISVAIDGTHYSSETVDFHFQDIPVVYSISPVLGPHHGGTPVQVTGEGFGSHGDLVCVFGTSTVPAQILSFREIRCISPPHLPGTGDSLRVSVAKMSSVFGIAPWIGQDPRRSDVTFLYVEIPRVLSIFPTAGPHSGGTNVRVQTSGSGFGAQVWCRFGTVTVVEGYRTTAADSSDLDPSVVLCRSPPMIKLVGPQSLEISGNGWDFSDSRIMYTFTVTPEVSKIIPQYGPRDGGNVVSVVGKDFAKNSTSLECMFGEIRVPGRARSSEVIECSVPQQVSTQRHEEVHEVVFEPLHPSQQTLQQLLSSTTLPSVYISFNGTQSTNSILMTASASEIQQALSPNVIPHVSNINVLQRTETTGTSSYNVLVWQIALPLAAYVMRLENACELPEIEVGVPSAFRYGVKVTICKVSTPCVTVRVITNGQDFAEGELSYAYVSTPRVLSVVPLAGPMTGGTNLTISGSDFLDGPSLVCSFGDYQTPATFVTSSTIWCLTSPQKTASTVFVRVLGNNAAESTDGIMSDSIVLFQYYPQIGFKTMTPTHGPNTGGTEIQIIASGIINKPTLSCAFLIKTASNSLSVRIVVPATFHNVTSLSCVAPSLAILMPASAPNWSDSSFGAAWVSISNNGADFVDTNDAFEYVPPIRLVSLTPTMGPQNGGTTIAVTAINIGRHAITHCKLGASKPIPATVVILAKLISSREVSCVTPRHASSISAGDTMAVPVSVSSNGIDFSLLTLTFTYIPSFEVVSATPLVGPTAGDTPILLQTTTSRPNLDSYNSIFCKFGEAIVEGKALSSSSFVCETPMHRPGVISLFMGVNGVDFDVYAGEFEFTIDNSTYLEISPLSGVVSGGTLVYVTGIDLDPTRSYSCKIGESVDSVVLAEFVNTTHVGCRTPPVASTGPAVVRISDNGHDFSRFNLTYVYVQPLFVTRINPTSGDISGGDMIRVTGGEFRPGVDQITCRFGDTVSQAVLLSASEVNCPAPLHQPIQDVQSVEIRSLSLVPRVQRITVASDPLRPTVQSLALYVDGDNPNAVRTPEIQEFTVSADSIPAVQSVQVTAQSFSGETFSIKTSILPVVKEVQSVQLQASTFIGGSFRLKLEEHETDILTSYATDSEVQAALEALSNVGHVTVTKTSNNVGVGSCTWEVTFEERAGDIPLLQLRNISLTDSGSSDVDVVITETIKGQGPALIGSYQLVVDGISSDFIPFDATEEEMTQTLRKMNEASDLLAVTRFGPYLNKAFEWQLTFSGFPGRTRSVSGVTDVLSGGAGVVAVVMLAPGFKSEQQEIVSHLSSGTFLCTIQSITTQPISVDALPEEVSSIFEDAGFGKTIVTSGSTGVGSWKVVFESWAGDLPLLDCGVGQTVSEVAAGTGTTLGGSFRLGYGGEWTSTLPFDASATTIEAALNSLNVLDGVFVAMADQPNINGGGSWLITFPGYLGSNVGTISADISTLVGVNPTVAVSIYREGNDVDGNVAFLLNGELSPTFSIKTEIFMIEEALKELVARITGFNEAVRVTKLPNTSQPGIVLTATFSLIVGNAPQLGLLAKEMLLGIGATISARTLQQGSNAFQGSFSLTYHGICSPLLPWDASTEAIASAISYMNFIPIEGVKVSRIPLISIAGMSPSQSGAVSGFIWSLTFPIGTVYPSEMISVEYKDTLTGPGKLKMSVTLISTETPRLTGTFKVAYGTSVTSNLDVSTDAEIMKIALMSQLGLANVQVSRRSVGGPNSVVWEITFNGLDAAVVPPLAVTVPTFSLTGTNAGASTSVSEPGSHAEIQCISIYGAITVPVVAFTINWNGQQSTAIGNSQMTATEMMSLLLTIPGIDRSLVVERYASISGVGFSWYILLPAVDSTASPVLLASIVGGVLPAGVSVNIVKYSATIAPISGTFKLQLSNKCTELTSGAYCTPSQTLALPASADSNQIARAVWELLDDPDLPPVVVASESCVVSNREYRWLITFPFVSYRAMNLISMDSSGLNGAKLTTAVKRVREGDCGNNAIQVSVELSSNGQDFSKSGIIYRYTSVPRVFSVSPTHGPLGGGTEVVLHGTNFVNSSALHCRFVWIDPPESVRRVAAYYINTSHAVCESPSGTREGDVVLEIATHHDLQSRLIIQSADYPLGVKFTYDSTPTFTSVFPNMGPTIGNFSVRITGGIFKPSHELRCKFGDGVKGGATVVDARWVNFDEIDCWAPPAKQVGVVALRVSLNAQNYFSTQTTFIYFAEQGIRRIWPIFGPATAAGTRVLIEGIGFVNSSLLSCRFGHVVVPGEFISASEMVCVSPSLSPFSGGLQSVPLSEHRHKLPDPVTGTVLLFPTAHYFPQYASRLVSVEVSNNMQEFTLSGVNYLYFDDEELDAVYPTAAYDSGDFLLFAHGRNFINSTLIACRVGNRIIQAVFIAPQLIVCPIVSSSIDSGGINGLALPLEASEGYTALVDVSNNGVDFTTSGLVFNFRGPCPTGYYCPRSTAGKKVACPRGSFCAGTGNGNFTLCYPGTFQPKLAQAECRRCPIGFHCPHAGMHMPRVCPAGFVCDVTGIQQAQQPCPEGHFCLEGTATTAISCTPLRSSFAAVDTTTGATGLARAVELAGELPQTLQRQKVRDQQQQQRQASSILAGRRSGCWRNETTDFGLQLGSHPSRFWMERRSFPLVPGSQFAPIRGRFCLDDSCLRLADSDNLRVPNAELQDDKGDLQLPALRRPVPCPPGTYCHAGTAARDELMKNFSSAQPCFESMYCPEGSGSPRGAGECPKGFYCPFGVRLSCPAGSYCPVSGLLAPLNCPPGTFNAQLGQEKCIPCPVGYICPGFNRVMPVTCPAGYVCSKSELSSPNLLCPSGFYCLNGTATADVFRNDTRLRPYPCKPGTYCLRGVVADEVRIGDYRYPQNCTEGFYCELGSSSPKGSGLCPRGFTCPSGTAVPIPTAKGTFAGLEGTVQAAQCAPGYYAPTIESKECIPCPPGTSCEEDGTQVAEACPPGSYRGSLALDGISCLACPQGTWSKNWELRGIEECVICPPGSVCPIDGITDPCAPSDLPQLYEPVTENNASLTFSECLDRGSDYYFGILLEPWIDPQGRGPHLLPSRDYGKCYKNTQPLGSVLYQRLADFHGPLYELTEAGAGIPHQGYGDTSQYPAPNLFGRGTLAIDLPVSQAFDPERNCTKGFYYENQWFPGTCEADVFCSLVSSSSSASSTLTTKAVAQAQPCPEGYVCDQSTTADTALSVLCPGGYVCSPGTTPDLTLEAPQGQLKELCPASKVCAKGTSESQKTRTTCPAGYFCPTGTSNPYIGEVADDALRRGLTALEANPFAGRTYTKYIGDGDVRIVSAHDMRCFAGADSDLLPRFHLVPSTVDPPHNVVKNRATTYNTKCARDHKWRMIELAIRRKECDCITQTKVVRRVFQLWKCTTEPTEATPTVYDPSSYGGWEIRGSSVNPARQCTFSTTGGLTVDLRYLLTADEGDDSFGELFQTSWTEKRRFLSYELLKSFVASEYEGQVSDIPTSRESIDPYIYDLHHAISLVEAYGDDTLNIAGFVSGSSDTKLLRLDACACANMLKCPNGTDSSAGVDDIYDCVKTGTEILQRVSLLPEDAERVINGTDYAELSGTGTGIGSIVLLPYEVAVITVNATDIARNLTYKDHYQISVYENCKPCPPRFSCDYLATSSSDECKYPNNDNTTSAHLYAECYAEHGDAALCASMPYYCEQRIVTDSVDNTTNLYPSCCACERAQMPYFFEDASSPNLGYPDDKHALVQLTITAVAKTELTVVVELLHGLYVQDFEEGFDPNRFDLYIFTPGRSDYSPSTPSTRSFLAFMPESTYDDLILPLNLPEVGVRVNGTLTYEKQVVDSVLLDHNSDVMVGDPDLPAKHGFMRNTQQNAILGSAASTVTVTISSSSSSSSGNETANITVVPPTEYFGLDQDVDPFSSVQRSNSWWSEQLDGADLLALPYLPYFSSCRGFGSTMSLAKLVESHPDCTLVEYEDTIEVNQYPWNKKMTPHADSCVVEYTVEAADGSSSSGTSYETLEKGVNMSCTYEEDLEGGAEKTRWYEATTDTVLFYLSRDPVDGDEFVAQPDDLENQPWGRASAFQSLVGTDQLVPVTGKSVMLDYLIFRSLDYSPSHLCILQSGWKLESRWPSHEKFT